MLPPRQSHVKFNATIYNVDGYDYIFNFQSTSSAVKYLVWEQAFKEIGQLRPCNPCVGIMLNKLGILNIVLFQGSCDKNYIDLS